MDLQKRRLYYNQCNPDVALPPEDARNVELDSFGDSEHPVRGFKWAESLALNIAMATGDPAIEKPACEFFTGLPGSGKSTEIKRLEHRLRQQDGANLLTVYMDADDFLDLTDRVDISDLRISILYAIERRILEAEGKDPDAAMKEGVLDKLVHTLGHFKMGGPKVTLPAGASLALEMKVQPSLRQEVRRRVAENAMTFLQETDREISELRARARRLGYAGIVVLFDSMEKLRGTSERFEEVLNSAENLFSHGAAYLRLPVHVLYTVPPALVLRLRVRVRFMPMIKLRERDGEPYQPGYDAARGLICKRIPLGDLREVFGTSDDRELEARLQQLIDWSAGYPREIVRLLRDAVSGAPLSRHGFEMIIGQAGDEYRRLILGTDLEWLALVAVEHRLAPRDEAQRRAADRMLSNNVVLRYQNTEEWYDVHPALLQMPALKDAIRRLQAARAAATANQG